MDMGLNLNTESVALAQPSPPLIVEPDATVGDVLRLLRLEKRGCVLVCRDDVLQGSFTERDAMRVMAEGGPCDAPIEQFMFRNPPTLRPHDSVTTAIRKLSFSGQRRLPIVDDKGHPLGVIKLSRIVHYLVEHVSKAVYTLPPKPNVLLQEREGA